MTNNTILSHTVFLKCLIKAFYKDDAVIYLDATTGLIYQSSHNCNTFNTIPNWYSSKVENLLDMGYETHFYKSLIPFIKLVRSNNHDIENLKIANSDILFKIFAFQQIRDVANTQAVLEKAGQQCTVSSCKKLQNHLIADESSSTFLSSELKESYIPIIRLNYSDLKFVAINTPIGKKYPDGTVRIFAVSPHLAIVLMPRHLVDSEPSDYVVKKLRDSDKEFVHEINSLLIAHAIVFQPHIVFGKDKRYLSAAWSQVKERLT